MELYKITKIGKVENPKHPWSDFGESKEFHVGVFTKEPEIGERFNLLGIDLKNRGISTSPVTKIIDENTFETLNSIYRYEKI
jgi:hypothetical protein